MDVATLEGDTVLHPSAAYNGGACVTYTKLSRTVSKLRQSWLCNASTVRGPMLQFFPLNSRFGIILSILFCCA